MVMFFVGFGFVDACRCVRIAVGDHDGGGGGGGGEI